MRLVICILVIIIIILIINNINFKKEIKNITKQIDENRSSYTSIRTKMLGKEVEDLVCKINYLYDENQKINSKTKDVEEELRQSISNMSHDLRTPLTSIMGYIQLIKNDEIGDQERNDYIEIIQKRTKSLQSLISSFYELSRIEGNEYKFKYTKINLNDILCENLAVFYNDFKNKSINPVIEVDENASEIISDEGVVGRVFVNLISNILKYGNDYVKISLQEKDGFIVTEFINNAPNLDEEKTKKIFDRFFTANESRSDQNTGLGLYITKVFVEKLGNEIEAELIEGNLVIRIMWKVN